MIKILRQRIKVEARKIPQPLPLVLSDHVDTQFEFILLDEKEQIVDLTTFHISVHLGFTKSQKRIVLPVDKTTSGLTFLFEAKHITDDELVVGTIQIVKDDVVDMVQFTVRVKKVYDTFTKSEQDNNTTADSFIFTQAEQSDKWVIKHDLNRYPSVLLLDEQQEVMYGSIKHISMNEMHILFNPKQNGTAILE